MTSLYDQSVPLFTKYLSNLSALIRKGAQYADEKAIKHEEVLKYRLASDSPGLDVQVQSCCNTVVWFVDRIGDLEHIAVEDNETTFEQLYERIDRTIAYLNTVDAKALEGKIDSPLVVQTRMGKFEFASGQAYLSEFAIPHFHFRLSTAYSILRTQGVPLGIQDYLKDVMHKV